MANVNAKLQVFLKLCQVCKFVTDDHNTGVDDMGYFHLLTGTFYCRGLSGEGDAIYVVRL